MYVTDPASLVESVPLNVNSTFLIDSDAVVKDTPKMADAFAP